MPPGTIRCRQCLMCMRRFIARTGRRSSCRRIGARGKHWNLAPGNLYSKPMKVHVGPGGPPIAISLDQVIPPIVPEARYKICAAYPDSERVADEVLGTPMYLSAIVLVPEGFDEHPQARFPLMIFHDHFVTGFDDFRTTPPDPNLKPNYSERFHLAGYNRIQQDEAYKEYQKWISPGFPRVLVMKIQHANPYYDDSYAVNSANLGPYGDAIETELIPAVEKKFRAIGQGWARFMYGGSTGGWESLAVQIFYPGPLQRGVCGLSGPGGLPRLYDDGICTRTTTCFTSRARTSGWSSRRCGTIWGIR